MPGSIHFYLSSPLRVFQWTQNLKTTDEKKEMQTDAGEKRWAFFLHHANLILPWIFPVQILYALSCWVKHKLPAAA